MPTQTEQNPTEQLQNDGRFTDREFKHFVSQVAAELNRGQKHDITGTPVPTLYGSGGMLSSPYDRPQMWSAQMSNITLLNALPLFRSRVLNEIQRVLTGVTAGAKAASDAECAPGDTPGDLKSFDMLRKFGHMKLTTKPVKLSELGLYDTYGVEERTILNFAQSNNRFMPDPLRGMNPASDWAKQLYTLAFEVDLALARLEIVGDNTVVDAAAAIGWRQEFDGLDKLITDGYSSATGGAFASPAVDSLVEGWNTAIGGSVNGLAIIQLIAAIFFSRQQLARKLGLNVNWAFAGDERMFFELTFLAGCTYAYARCTDGDAGAPIGRTAAEIEARTLEMRNGQYLLVGGLRIPFFMSSGAEVEDSEAPEGTLFLVPLTANGRPVTYLQHAPMDNPDIQRFIETNRVEGVTATNNGLYLLTTSRSEDCVQTTLQSRIRMLVDMPFLGARIDGIEFPGYVGYRSGLVGDASHYNGGTTYWNGPFVS